MAELALDAANGPLAARGRVKAVMDAMTQMVKLDVAALEKAYDSVQCGSALAMIARRWAASKPLEEQVPIDRPGVRS